MAARFWGTSQSGFVLRTLAAVGLLGLVLLLAMAFGQPDSAAGSRYLFVGGLAALAGLGLGGVIGLIFGLPESSQVVISPAATDSKEAATADTPTSPDWYQDSSSLERIATWLTGAIIALSLANFDGWTTRFDRAALAVGAMMSSQTVADREAAPRRVLSAAEVLRSITRASSEPDEVFERRREAARISLKVAQQQADQARGEGAVTGGLLLGSYTLIGFIMAYLWTRRYLPAELAKGRREMRQEGRLDKRDADDLAKARSAGLAMSTSGRSADPKAASDAVTALAEAAHPHTMIADGAPNPSVLKAVDPGKVVDDCWKGQFDGRPTSTHAEITAAVREASGRPGLFLIDLFIGRRSPADRASLAGSSARLYLHPSFPEPIIRPITFDAEGMVEIKLAATGAFTVGVQLIPTGERMELDLAGLKNAPADFRLN